MAARQELIDGNYLSYTVELFLAQLNEWGTANVLDLRERHFQEYLTISNAYLAERAALAAEQARNA
jgi:hypothetical protein